MKPEHYRQIRKEKPKRKGKISARKSRMLAVAREWKPITSPQLREAYSTKIEWAKKLNSRRNVPSYQLTKEVKKAH